MQTLVLPPRYTPDSIALAKAATDAGWETERLASWRVPGWLSEADVVLYGEPLFAAVVAEPLEVSLLEPPFSWVADLPEGYRKRRIEFMDLGNARRIQDRAFIKPADDKCFAAQVYESGDGLPKEDILPAVIGVLVAEPVLWEVEFRCFVLDHKVKPLSPYLRNGDLAQLKDGTWSASEEEWSEAELFAASVLEDQAVRMPPSVVLDVGRIRGRGWAVVEANAAWGSGGCGCRPADVLTVIRRACVRTSSLTSEDTVWVLHRIRES